MGINFRSLFESGKDKNKRERKEQRQRDRQVKKNLEATKAQIESKTSELNRYRAEAKDFYSSGQKGAAMQSLEAYRNTLAHVQKRRRSLYVFEKLTDDLRMAQADQDSVAILNELASVLQIDPEDMEDNLEAVLDKVEETEDSDAIMKKTYDKLTAGADKVSDAIPSVEELMSELEAEVSGGKAQSESSGSKEKSEEIDKLRKNLGELENSDGEGGK